MGERRGRHHFIPQFHLKQWAIDGKVRRWWRVKKTGKLLSKRLPPSGIAYKTGLYALEKPEDGDSQRIERKLFGPIDQFGSSVLSKLVACQLDELTDEEGAAWSVYLHAMIARQPHVVAKLHEDALAKFRPYAREELRRMVEAGGIEVTQQFQQIIDGVVDAPFPDAGVIAMTEHILNNREEIKYYGDLKWGVVEMRGSPGLVLGDSPVTVFAGLHVPETLVMMPISPVHMFVAGASDALLSRLMASIQTRATHLLNRVTIQAAQEEVYGEAERDFVERWLPKRDAQQ